MSHHLQFLQEAQYLAEDSKISPKHAAIIVSSGTIIAQGINKEEAARKKLSREYLQCNCGKTVHAEYDCVLRPYKKHTPGEKYS